MRGYGYCEAGFSAEYMKDPPYGVIMGAVGSRQWTGKRLKALYFQNKGNHHRYFRLRVIPSFGESETRKRKRLHIHARLRGTGNARGASINLRHTRSVMFPPIHMQHIPFCVLFCQSVDLRTTHRLPVF